jgi:hypothetical protein
MVYPHVFMHCNPSEENLYMDILGVHHLPFQNLSEDAPKLHFSSYC